MGKATRDDSDKLMLQLLDPEFIKGIAGVMTMGAKKYDRDNWKESAGTELSDEYIHSAKGCLLRHTYAYLGGEYLDPESGYPHLFHVATNLMILEYYERKSQTERDRGEDSTNLPSCGNKIQPLFKGPDGVVISNKDWETYDRIVNGSDQLQVTGFNDDERAKRQGNIGNEVGSGTTDR